MWLELCGNKGRCDCFEAAWHYASRGKPAEKVRGRERSGRRVSGEARAEKGRGRERTCRRRVSDVMYCNVK